MSRRRRLSSNYTCVDGRQMRHDPQTDDPYLQTDVGKCPDCDGDGCDPEAPIPRRNPAPPLRQLESGEIVPNESDLARGVREASGGDAPVPKRGFA